MRSGPHAGPVLNLGGVTLRGVIRSAVRFLAGVVGAVGVALPVLGLLPVGWGILGAGQAPDPWIPDGDPCCGHPDSWSEIYTGAGWTIGLSAALALCGVAGIAALAFAQGGRPPAIEWFVVPPVVAAAVTAVLLALVIAPHRGEGRVAPECDSFRFRDAEWRSPDKEVRRRTILGLDACDLLDGRTRAQVEGRLGEPEHRSDATRGDRWSYGGLSVYFTGDRVSDTSAGYDD